MHKSIKCVIIGQSGANSAIYKYLQETAENPRYFDSPLELYLCDLSGRQLKHDIYLPPYLDVDIFIICYSVMDLNTFEKIRGHWMPALRKFYPQIPSILVGTEAQADNTSKNHTSITYVQGWCMAYEIGAMAYKEFMLLEDDDLEAIFDLAIECVKQYRSKMRRNKQACRNICSIM